jgi:hypothetical protein
MGARISNPTKRAMIKVGLYTGDGTDNRDIDIGINLSAKTNVTTTLYRDSGNNVQFRWEVGQGDLTKGATNSEAANIIQSLTSTGFQIGSSADANAAGITYRYQVIWEEL